MRPKKLDVSYSEWQEQVSPVGTRYTTRMSKVFSEESYIQAVLDVEAENVRVLSELYPSKVPRSAARRIKSVADTRHVRPSKVREEEARRTHHEMGAIIGVMSKEAGDSGRYVHFAMTSADATETAKAMQVSRALRILMQSASEARDSCLKASLEWKEIPSMARTHGQHAIPTSFGLPFAFFGYCLQKSIDRLEYDLKTCVEGKLSGVIGTYDVHFNEGMDGRKVEEETLARLKVKPSEISMQIPPREGIAYIISDLAVLCGRLETIAAYIKDLKRTEILELSERPDEGSVGSSAMPHKSMHGNPFIEERCISIARIVRGYALSCLESVFTEDMRDLSASLSDRIAIPEAFILADYSCGLMRNVVERVAPMTENIDGNMGRTKGTTASPLVMSRLVEKGLSRQAARDASMRAAGSAFASGKSYLEALIEDRYVSRLIPKKELEELCDPDSSIGRSKEIIERIARRYLKRQPSSRSPG